MEPAPAPGPPAAPPAFLKRGTSLDPVKAEGILCALTRKERSAAREWADKWGFYTQADRTKEEAARALGLSPEQYRAARRQLSGAPDPPRYPFRPPALPALPHTTNGMTGWLCRLPLERYGRLARTGRDLPARPPPPPGQPYDPFKQTFIFLGIDGDPFSLRLPAEEAPPALARPLRPRVAPLSEHTLRRAGRCRAAHPRP